MELVVIKTAYIYKKTEYQQSYKVSLEREIVMLRLDTNKSISCK